MSKGQKSIYLQFLRWFYSFSGAFIVIFSISFLYRSYNVYRIEVKRDLQAIIDIKTMDLFDHYDHAIAEAALIAEFMQEFTEDKLKEELNHLLKDTVEHYQITIYEGDSVIMAIPNSQKILDGITFQIPYEQYVFTFVIDQEAIIPQSMKDDYHLEILTLEEVSLRQDEKTRLQVTQRVNLGDRDYILQAYMFDGDFKEHFLQDYLYYYIISIVILILVLILIRISFENIYFKSHRRFINTFKLLSEKPLDYFVTNQIQTEYQEYQDIMQLISTYSRVNKDQYDQKIIMLENELKKAQESNQAKTAYLANMSHEMRTPLNSVIGYTQLLEKVGFNDVSQVEEYFNRINDSAQILLQKINDILDLAKIEAKQFELIIKPKNFRAIIKEVYNLLFIMANKKGIKFSYQIAPEIPEYLMLDETRFKQILINLLSNAIKYTKEGFVKLEIDLFGYINDQVVLDYKITDSGVGISDKDLERIFIPFVQVGDERQGTGLGLAITRDLIKLMDGEINVTSKLGVGTIVSFTTIFTIAKHSETNLEADKTDDDVKAHILDKRILVVEDNPMNQMLISEIFKVFGKTDLVVAEDGLQAIEVCKRESFDIIFMDIQMPNCDGIEATKQIRAISAYQNTPIIALTANAFSEQVNEYLHLGMTDYLKKPIDIKELKKILIEHLSF